MMMQALSRESDFAVSFHRERETRLASTAWKSQSMSPEAYQTYGTGVQASSGVMAVPTRGAMVKPWLKDALKYVDQIDQDAREEGCPPISDVAKSNAKRVLFIAGSGSLEPHVYPSMDGEVAVYFKSPVAPAALLILLNDEGGAGCFWSIRGKSERQRYDDASELPVGFVLAQLRALGAAPLSQSLE